MTTATAVGYVEMRIAEVVGLAADDESFDYVVLEVVQALGGRVRQVRIDRVVEETYVATVEVEGPLGLGTRQLSLCAGIEPTKTRPRPERRLLMGPLAPPSPSDDAGGALHVERERRADPMRLPGLCQR